MNIVAFSDYIAIIIKYYTRDDVVNKTSLIIFHWQGLRSSPLINQCLLIPIIRLFNLTRRKYLCITLTLSYKHQRVKSRLRYLWQVNIDAKNIKLIGTVMNAMYKIKQWHTLRSLIENKLYIFLVFSFKLFIYDIKLILVT